MCIRFSPCHLRIHNPSKTTFTFLTNTYECNAYREFSMKAGGFMTSNDELCSAPLLIARNANSTRNPDILRANAFSGIVRTNELELSTYHGNGNTNDRHAKLSIAVDLVLIFSFSTLETFPQSPQAHKRDKSNHSVGVKVLRLLYHRGSKNGRGAAQVAGVYRRADAFAS